MPLSVRMDAELGIARIEASPGILTLRDLLEAIAPLVAHPEFQPDTPQLLDLSAVDDVPLTAGELQELARAFAEQGSAIGGGRVAVVAPQPVVFGTTRMFEALSGKLPNTVRVFRDLETALTWLRAGRTGGASG
jgi:hypothetical protein